MGCHCLKGGEIVLLNFIEILIFLLNFNLYEVYFSIIFLFSFIPSFLCLFISSGKWEDFDIFAWLKRIV